MINDDGCPSREYPGENLPWSCTAHEYCDRTATWSAMPSIDHNHVPPETPELSTISVACLDVITRSGMLSSTEKDTVLCVCSGGRSRGGDTDQAGGSKRIQRTDSWVTSPRFFFSFFLSLCPAWRCGPGLVVLWSSPRQRAGGLQHPGSILLPNVVWRLMAAGRQDVCSLGRWYGTVHTRGTSAGCESNGQ